MSDKRLLLLKVFLAELEDLQIDLEDLKVGLKARRGLSEITEYVYLENTALIQNELNSLKTLVKDIQTSHLDENKTYEVLLESLKSLLKEETRAYQFPGVVLALTERKLEKVVKYINQEF